MRTNILIDNDIMQEALKITGIKTKKEVVDLALRELVQNHSRMDLSELKGKINFIEGYDYKALREGI
ncbi:MAG: type II toxin-antitoxin system VapB family antitoxin [Defluviitaleaceae bacterium]|nr:type II toxin-antitoxin system VapB family antitoxin [Defluviitaleaceae bacterium]